MEQRIYRSGISSGYYINGNYLVSYRSNSLTKRSLRYGEDLISSFPDSIDLKITNKCNNGCPFCHENSTPTGKVAKLEDIEYLINTQLPKECIEIAIGGGNVLDLETISETSRIIKLLHDSGYRTRITIAQADLEKVKKILDSYEVNNNLLDIFTTVGGIGISLIKKEKNYEDIIPEKMYYLNNVFHIIAGIFPEGELKKLLDSGFPVLVLGYKQFGRAKGTELPKGIHNFEKTIKKIIFDCRKNGKLKSTTIAFDNLAMEQLHIKDCLLQVEFESIYLGNEGSCSMYVDAVEKTFAINSRSEERVSWNDINMLDFFNKLK